MHEPRHVSATITPTSHFSKHTRAVHSVSDTHRSLPTSMAIEDAVLAFCGEDNNRSQLPTLLVLGDKPFKESLAGSRSGLAGWMPFICVEFSEQGVEEAGFTHACSADETYLVGFSRSASLFLRRPSLWSKIGTQSRKIEQYERRILWFR